MFVFGKQPTAPISPAELWQRAGMQKHLPTLPAAASRAIQIANDPKCEIADFVSALETDPALTTDILRVANSPLYRLGKPVATLSQAVVRLGLKECRNLVLTVGFYSLFRKTPPTQKKACQMRWSHLFQTAKLCRLLNHCLDLGFDGEEFTCGLVHDLGRLLFVFALPSRLGELDRFDFCEQDGSALLEHERYIAGTDHCQLGAWFATINQLPGLMVSCAAFHHQPPQAAETHGRMVALVQLADDISNHLMRGEPPERYDIRTRDLWQTVRHYLTEDEDAASAHVGRTACQVAQCTEQALN